MFHSPFSLPTAFSDSHICYAHSFHSVPFCVAEACLTDLSRFRLRCGIAMSVIDGIVTGCTFMSTSVNREVMI